MNYSPYSNEQLIQMIEGLELLNGQLLNVRAPEISLDFPWSVNLGIWY